MLNAWLHFTNSKFPNSTDIKEILDQPILRNPLTKLDFYSNNPFFTRFHPPVNFFKQVSSLLRDSKETRSH